MAEEATGTPRLGILLAMAMFVFVIDTSFMNVSISAVVRDLDTTVSGVQSAVAIEALVSAAFILIGSKIGDLFGRKRAYVVGLLFYASGALAMVFAQGLAAIIVFWAVIGGLGASLYLPAMQSLIHGNFEGKMQAKVFALIGAAGAIAAAIGPLLGGFVTTLLSWRVGFLLEAVIIAVVLLGQRADPRRALHGRSVRRRRRLDPLGPRDGRLGARRPRLAGGRRVRRGAARGRAWPRWAPSCYWLVAAQARRQAHAVRPVPVRIRSSSRYGITQGVLQQIALGGMLIALPIYLQLVLGLQRAAGRPVARAAVPDDVRASRCSPAGGRAGGARPASSAPGSRCSRSAIAAPDPDRPARGHRLVPRRSR